MRARNVFGILLSIFAAASFLITDAASPAFADSKSDLSPVCVPSPTAKQDSITPLTFARLAQCHMREVVVVRAEVKDSSKKEKEGGSPENKNETLGIFPYQQVRFPLYYYTIFDKRVWGVRMYARASGVLIASVGSKGYVLTNAHVAENALSLSVTLFDEKTYPARVIMARPNSKLDIAILEIEKKDSEDPFAVAALGDSDALMVGESVMSIGHPLNLLFSVHPGNISQKYADADEQETQFIQLKTDTYPGHSGSPVYDHQGRVVAIIFAVKINTGDEQITTIGLAIAVNSIKPFIEKGFSKQ